ncbi:unnamed protein product [Choristocarpus tenellus]
MLVKMEAIPLISGAGAGLVCSILCSPLDVAKIRIQVQDAVLPRNAPRKYCGVLPTLTTIWVEEGARGWYKGLAPAMICIPIFWGIYFHVYEQAKGVFKQATGQDHHLLPAIAAGAITDLVTNPFWVVRTRMQTQVCSCSATGTDAVSKLKLFLSTWFTADINCSYCGQGVLILALL